MFARRTGCADVNPIRLGPAIHCEDGYQVREVLDDGGRSEGFTFEGPGFSALIIYPTFAEALQGLQALASMTLPDDRPAVPVLQRATPSGG
jgi:hypothetical protein